MISKTSLYNKFKEKIPEGIESTDEIAEYIISQLDSCDENEVDTIYEAAEMLAEKKNQIEESLETSKMSRMFEAVFIANNVASSGLPFRSDIDTNDKSYVEEFVKGLDL